jgi:O-antigen/teichoic acid export membrane protein
MSLKQNVFASYISQAYVTLIGILMVPMYVRYMGAEAYGLVGFFAMLQAWFNLLDLGLSPTIARETARFHAGAIGDREYRQLFRALSVVFIGIAVLGGGALCLLAPVITTHWLSLKALALNEVVFAVETMAISVALRWVGGLYRGVIAGSERLVWQSVFNVAVATLRFVAPFATMHFFGYSPVPFFVHQLVVSVIEVVGLAMMAYRLLPKLASEAIGWSVSPVRPILKFSLTIAFTSSVWVLLTQSDKLVLSGVLPLDEYGYFTLAVLVASGIMVITGPVSSSIMPRMAKLHAENKDAELIKVYRRATQWVSLIAGAAAVVVAMYPHQLLYVWTGDWMLADKASGILRLYAIGNGLLAVGAFPYYLQYAIGNLRYHLIGNAVLVVLLVPTVLFVAYHFGAIGAGYVWLGMNACYLLGWVSFVHHRLRPGLAIIWFSRDVLAICAASVVVGLVSLAFAPQTHSKPANFIILLCAGVVVLGGATLSKLFLDRRGEPV